MARPKKTSLAPPSTGPVDGSESPPGSVEGVLAAKVPGLDKHGLPPRDIDGRPNPAYYRAAYAAVFSLTFDAVKSGEAIPWNADSVMKMIDREAEAAGFDPKTIKDQRPPEQVVADAMIRLSQSPAEIWELSDDEIDAVEKAMDKADKGCFDYIEKTLRTTGPKVWRDRLAKVRRLRERARNRCTLSQIQRLMPHRKTVIPGDHEILKAAIEAAWVLRVMAYVGRSNMAHLANGDPADSIYMIGYHHCKMACDIWEAENGVRYGKPLDRSSQMNRINRGEIEYKGAIIVIAPGHGKTEFGRMWMNCRYKENPHTQALLGHSRSDEAEKNLAYVGMLFKKDNPAGRRNISLFGLTVAESNAKRFRLDLPDRTRQHSAAACGIKAKISGASASVLWPDDPVDQKEAEQETERDRTFQLLNGTWFTRLRGNKGTFVLITATLWHKSDAVNRLIELARDGKAMFRVSIQRCGGPKTSPPFFAIWPEVYPPAELRRRYETMRNPALYAAAYMANPVAEERRIVKHLRYYDASTEEHKRFIESSTKYMSIDPAATRGERSDLAGVVYAGMGTVHVTKLVDGRVVDATEQRLRLITVESIPATQSDLVQHVVNLAETHPIDYVLVETRSGFHGTADMFQNYHGIDPIRLDPKNKNKEERLRAAAPAMENFHADLGLCAVVEFPGLKLPNGQMILDPRFKRLAEEILDFGVCATDDALDALTQMVIYLMPELGIGTGGIVSKVVAQTNAMRGDPDLLKILAGYENKKTSGNHAQDEHGWLKKNGWSMPEGGMPQG